MPRAYTREPGHPDTKSEQTHDDREGLDEEDGEQDVPGDWRDVNRSGRAPGVAQNESRDTGGDNSPGAENRRRDGDNKRGAGLAGILAL
jgi:hypothetical protein